MDESVLGLLLHEYYMLDLFVDLLAIRLSLAPKDLFLQTLVYFETD